MRVKLIKIEFSCERADHGADGGEPTVPEKFAAIGTTIVGGTPEHFAEHIRSETAKWGKVIKTAGIKPE